MALFFCMCCVCSRLCVFVVCGAVFCMCCVCSVQQAVCICCMWRWFFACAVCVVCSRLCEFAVCGAVYFLLVLCVQQVVCMCAICCMCRKQGRITTGGRDHSRLGSVIKAAVCVFEKGLCCCVCVCDGLSVRLAACALGYFNVCVAKSQCVSFTHWESKRGKNTTTPVQV